MALVESKDLLDVRAIRQSFPKPGGGDLSVLEDVNLALREGEIVGLLGRSGSGKSTLLRLIAGLNRPTGGDIVYHGAAAPRPRQGHRHGVPELRALPLAHRARERRAGAGGARHARARDAQAGARRHRPDRPRRLRIRLSEGTVGRHAPARRLRARPRRASGHPADGRAVLGARHPHRGDPARRLPRPLVRGPDADQIGAAGDPQHRGGRPHVRPRPGVRFEPGPDRPGDQDRPAAASQSRRHRFPQEGGLHLHRHDREVGRSARAGLTRSAFPALASRPCCRAFPSTCSPASWRPSPRRPTTAAPTCRSSHPRSRWRSTISFRSPRPCR